MNKVLKKLILLVFLTAFIFTPILPILYCFDVETVFAQEKQKEKEVDLERLSPILVYGFGLKKHYMPTTNFVIYYDGGITTRKYASKVGAYFEYAWGKIVNTMGYEVPKQLKKYKLPIYILKKVEDSKGGQASTRKLGLLPCIEVENKVSTNKLKTLSSHELFHIFQGGYDEKEALWLKEATAVWIEDEIYKERLPELGYIRDEYLWIKHWSNINISLFDMRGKFAYGSSIFFKYLTEHAPAGTKLVKQIWEECSKKKGPNAFEALRLGLGDIGPDFNFLSDYFRDFCAAVITKTGPAPYNFIRGKEITGWIRSKLKINDWYYLVYVGGRIEESRKFFLKPLSAMYFIIRPPKELLDKSNLYIGIKRWAKSPLTFKVVKHLGSMIGGYAVENIDFPEGELAAVKKIQDFAQDIDAVPRVTLVVGNPSTSSLEETFEFCTATGDPPYVKEVEVWRNGYKELIYHAKWEENGEKRKLKSLKEGFKFKKRERFIRNVQVKITFSEEIAETPKPRIKLDEIKVKESRKSPFKNVWEGKVRSLPIDKDKKSIQIEIDAFNRSETRLDADPSTKTHLKWNKAKKSWAWAGYEGDVYEGVSEGGKDTKHEIDLAVEEKLLGIKGTMIRSVPGGVLVKEGTIEMYDWDSMIDFATEDETIDIEIVFSSEEGKDAIVTFGMSPPFTQYKVKKDEWFGAELPYTWGGQFTLPKGAAFNKMKGTHTLSVTIPGKRGENTLTGWPFKIDSKEVAQIRMDSILSKSNVEAIKPKVKFQTIPETLTQPGIFRRGYKSQTGYFYFKWDDYEKLAEGTMYIPEYTLDGNLGVQIHPDEKLARDEFYDINPYDSAEKQAEQKEKFNREWEDAKGSVASAFDRACTWRIVIVPTDSPKPEGVSVIIWKDEPEGPYDRYLSSYNLRCLEGRYVIDANLQFIGDMGTFAKQLHGKMIRKILDAIVLKTISNLKGTSCE